MHRPVALLLLTLASCGGASSDNPFVGSQSGDGSVSANLSTSLGDVDYGNRHSLGLARASAADGAATLAQAVRSTNRRCSSIARSEYKGSFEHRAFWAVQCGTADYLLTIAGEWIGEGPDLRRPGDLRPGMLGAVVAGTRAAALQALLERMPGAVAEPMTASRGSVPLVALYKVMRRMFAILSLRDSEFVILKCDPNRADMLREQYHGIGHRSHLDRRYWISVELNSDVPAEEVERLAVA